ncbi:MAG: bacillithiol system redox-active protein YtxJ [Maribacter sp.]|nr:bacillithiol system redox-active protein YtxJ [Maribacter sp.]
MSMFNNLFGSKKKMEETSKNTVSWIALTTSEQLDEIAQKSLSRTQMIFKHSTICGTSRMVLNRFGKDITHDKDKADLYYLDLHRFRELSNEVGKRFKVLHQSPQLLIIRNGIVVAHDSHGGIIEIDLNKYL